MADSVSIQARKTGTVTLTLGTAKLIQGPKGEKGDTGLQGVGIDSVVLNEDYSLTVGFTDGNSVTTPSIRGEKGDIGPQGPIGEQGPVGPQGAGISSIELTQGDHSAGTTDSYTVTLTNGESYVFTVYNGLDGNGAGDMQAKTYDPTGKREDVFSYARAAARAAMSEGLRKFVIISGAEPATGPVLWFDTGADLSEKDAVMLWLGGGEDTTLMAGVSGRDYPVTNVSPRGVREEERIFYIEVS